MFNVKMYTNDTTEIIQVNAIHAFNIWVILCNPIQYYIT